MQIDCSDEYYFSPIRLLIQNYWIEIDTSDYIYRRSDSSNQCILLILENQKDEFILGLPVFQGYYTTHNMDTKLISFAPFKGGSKLNLESLKFGANTYSFLL